MTSPTRKGASLSETARRGTCIAINNGSLDPKTMIIVETAFDEAWIALRTNGHDNIRPEELARCILHLAMEGERDPVQLHDGALLALNSATTWRKIWKQ
jgi:hypothetical protein